MPKTKLIIAKKKRPSFAKKVERVLNKQSELKYYYSSLDTTVGTTASILSLSSISQGNSVTTRVGDRVNPTSLSIRGRVAVADAYNLVRILVFKWNNNNLSDSPTSAELISNISSGEAITTSAPLVHKNYKMLLDKTLVVTTDNAARYFKYNIKLNRDKEILFNAGANNGHGLYYVCVVSDSAAASHPDVYLQSRLRFRDS